MIWNNTISSRYDCLCLCMFVCLCLCVMYTGGNKMCLHDAKIMYASVIIDILLQRKSPLYTFVFYALQIKPPPNRTVSCNQVCSHTNPKKHQDVCDSWGHKVQEWHKVYVSSNQEIYVHFSTMSCFPQCSIYLHRFTVAQAYPKWLEVSSALGV